MVTEFLLCALTFHSSIHQSLMLLYQSLTNHLVQSLITITNRIGHGSSNPVSSNTHIVYPNLVLSNNVVTLLLVVFFVPVGYVRMAWCGLKAEKPSCSH